MYEINRNKVQQENQYLREQLDILARNDSSSNDSINHIYEQQLQKENKEFDQLVKNHKQLSENHSKLLDEKASLQTQLHELQKQLQNHHLHSSDTNNPHVKQLQELRSKVEALQKKEKMSEISNDRIMQLKSILKDSCRVLEIENMDELPTTLSKMKTVLSAVPKMERFVIDVCDSCKRITESLSQDTMISPKTVPFLIQQWGVHLKELSSYKETEILIIKCLSARVNGDKIQDANQYIHSIHKSKLIGIITQLIANENKLIKAGITLDLADRYIMKKPEEIPDQLCRHFMRLFDVGKLEGVIPKMNKLYMYVDECRNVINSLKDLFGLSEKTPSYETVIQARKIIDDKLAHFANA
ncbi:hypothetical protein AKO1_006752, partial [Acrasis kona]